MFLIVFIHTFKDTYIATYGIKLNIIIITSTIKLCQFR